MQWEKGTAQEEDKLFDFKVAPTDEAINGLEGQVEVERGLGPMALCYKENMGWIAEQLGPASGHWKRRAREARNEGLNVDKASDVKKRADPITLEELQPHISTQKRRKVTERNSTVDGDEAVAAEQHRRAQ